MGCDIHLVLEKRHGEKWVGIDTFNGHHRPKWALKDGETYDYSSPVTRSRNYVRFAALAGVRGAGPEAKGVPHDASDLTKLTVEDWGSDGHSHSWLPLKEAAHIFLQTGFRPDEEVDDFTKEYPESYFFNVDASEGSRNNIDDFRVVFWFDN